MFFDELYTSVFIAVTLGLGEIAPSSIPNIFEGILNYPLQSLRPCKPRSRQPPPRTIGRTPS